MYVFCELFLSSRFGIQGFDAKRLIRSSSPVTGTGFCKSMMSKPPVPDGQHNLKYNNFQICNSLVCGYVAWHDVPEPAIRQTRVPMPRCRIVHHCYSLHQVQDGSFFLRTQAAFENTDGLTAYQQIREGVLNKYR